MCFYSNRWLGGVRVYTVNTNPVITEPGSGPKSPAHYYRRERDGLTAGADWEESKLPGPSLSLQIILSF